MPFGPNQDTQRGGRLYCTVFAIQVLKPKSLRIVVLLPRRVIELPQADFSLYSSKKLSLPDIDNAYQALHVISPSVFLTVDQYHQIKPAVARVSIPRPGELSCLFRRRAVINAQSVRLHIVFIVYYEIL